ncbi:30S ribosomal protein S20 [bacterium]|nr:30S ribosomal protein S20 [bacterium]
MATHKSAIKRHRQSLKRKARNNLAETTIRTTVKKALAFLEAGKMTDARDQVKLATTLLDRAVSRGIMHRKTASRKISRLTTRVSKTAAK